MRGVTLGQNYPNPFNPITTIEYSIYRKTHINLSVFSVDGRLVCTIVNANQKPNRYSVIWDGKNNRGVEVAGGIYFRPGFISIYRWGVAR